MSKILLGLFSDSKRAGSAIAELKEKGFVNDISVLARKKGSNSLNENEVQQNVADTAAIGAGVGAVAGAIWAGLSAVALPGLGLLVGGPLAALISGAIGGAATGGIVGALTDLGFPEDLARDYEGKLKQGQVAIGVTGKNDGLAKAKEILANHGAKNIHTAEKGDRV